MATLGTYSVADLLDVKEQSILTFGREAVMQVVQDELAAHNTIVDELLGSFTETTPENARRYGTPINAEMREIDEYAQGETQKVTTGTTVGFPLRKFEISLGWTKDYFTLSTPRDLMLQMAAAQRADLNTIRTQIRNAIFAPTNSTFTERFSRQEGIDIAVKAFLNADSVAIPSGPNGESFEASTHTHYLATATLTNSDAVAAVNHLVEHGHGNMVKIYINRADASAWKALSGFHEYVPVSVVAGLQDDHARGTLDTSNLGNRAIGVFEDAEVWVKPWVYQGYAFVTDIADPQKPLAHRVHSEPMMRGFRLNGEFMEHPYEAEQLERYIGVAPWVRTNGVIYQFTNATYQDPT